ncbi:hypothetical protein ACN28I_11790 [Archangium gephyra]|uniref:hypothetical protein n=1 Tax=Archangium gephyra TaxID=48 RepID=UPI003B76BBDD
MSLQTSSGFHFCGGSILNANWIPPGAGCRRRASPRSAHRRCGAGSAGRGRARRRPLGRRGARWHERTAGRAAR